MTGDTEAAEENFDLRDAVYDAQSVDDLRAKVSGVLAFWRARNAGNAAANIMRFLDQLAFAESPAEIVVHELQDKLARLATSDPRATPILEALSRQK